MQIRTYFLESEKGLIFKSNTPCSLIILHASLSGLFNPWQKLTKEKIFYNSN